MKKNEFDPLSRMASGPELQERLASASAAPVEGRQAVDERAACEALTPALIGNHEMNAAHKTWEEDYGFHAELIAIHQYAAVAAENAFAAGWRAALATAPTMRESVRPEPGTTEYGSWINNAQKEANIRFSWIDQKFKWLCAFEQALHAGRANAEGEKS